ncbi:MAG: hypothetical protein Q8Q14_04710 [Gemmatimonadales bacterium]|nr:hypothetical protein [Gemmatimonadales bacterium]
MTDPLDRLDWTRGAPKKSGRWLCDVGDDAGTGLLSIIYIEDGARSVLLAARYRDGMWRSLVIDPGAPIRRHAPLPDPAAIRAAAFEECARLAESVRRTTTRRPRRLTRSAYERLIAEDLAWLDLQPRTLERQHIAEVLRASPGHEYGPDPRADVAHLTAELERERAAAAQRKADAQVAAVAEEMARLRARLKNAARIATGHDVHRYLIVNTVGRLDGAAKVLHHRRLCEFYVAAHFGLVDPRQAQAERPDLYERVHSATQALTSYMDQMIGFPIDERPDYDALAPLFFERFHSLALAALAGSEGE